MTNAPWTNAMVLAEPVAEGDSHLRIKYRCRIEAEQLYIAPRRIGKVQAHWAVVERGVNGTEIAEHPAGATLEWWDAEAEAWVA